MGLLRRPVLHPFLAAAYPVLALLAANQGQVRPSIANRPLILSIVVAAVLLGLSKSLVRDWTRAAMLSTWAVLLFYAYGHVYNALREFELAGAVLGRHRYLVPTWLLLGSAGAYAILRSSALHRAGTAHLNLVLSLAVLLPLLQIAARQLNGTGDTRDQSLAASPLLDLPGDRVASGQLPDVYYLVLDAYARADTLSQAFAYENSYFLDALRDLGFRVADCSQSNYAQTELSLASSLNALYLDDLLPGELTGPEDRSRLWPLIRNSAVRQALERFGYRVIAFETGYYWTELEDADLYLAPRKGPFSGMTAFEATLLRSTAGWAAIDAMPVLPSSLVRDLDRSADAHRERLHFVLERLEAMPQQPGPKFVFAHIVSPHRPFVFDADGNPMDDDYDWTYSSLGAERYAEGYRQQLSYLNTRLLGVLERITIDSHPPPVVLLQGDHGPEEGSNEDRMRTLNAYFLGQESPNAIYDRITPVNSFRVIFNVIFGASIPLLADQSYFSTYDAPFDYRLIPLRCPT